MSNTIRRIKYREKDPMTIDFQREIERIELEEAMNEPYDYDDEDDPFSLSDTQLMEDSYNPRG